MPTIKRALAATLHGIRWAMLALATVATVAAAQLQRAANALRGSA